MKRIACFILCIATLLTLCACGSKPQDPTNSGNIINSGNTNDSVELPELIAPEDRPTLPAEGEYTLSEYLATGETIWYVIEEYMGKDSKIGRVYLIEPQGVLYTMHGPGTLGELSQMEDAEIAAMVKENHFLRLSTRFPLADETQYRNQKRYELLQYNFLEDVMLREGEELELIICERLGFYREDAEQEESLKQIYTEFSDMIAKWQCFIMEHGKVDNFGYIMATLMTALENPTEYLAQNIEQLPFSEEDKNELFEISRMLDSVTKMYYDRALAKKQAYLQEAQKPFPYRLTIVTDMTGNNTSHMELVYKALTEYGYSYKSMSFHYKYPAGQQQSNSNSVVYDSLYGGYTDDGAQVLTRVNGKIHFTLDPVGKDGFPIDVKDYETLFH